MNAANDGSRFVAFLDRSIDFLRISGLIDAALEQFPATAVSSLDEVLAADASARAFVRN